MADESDTYEAVSAQSLDQFSQSASPIDLAASTLTYPLVARSPDPARLSQAMEMAEKGYGTRPQAWDILSVGMAAFRTGDYERARDFCAAIKESHSFGNGASIAAAFLSMTAAKTNDFAAAAQHLARAREIHEAMLAECPSPHDLTANWHDLMAAKLAIREATDLLDRAKQEPASDANLCFQ